MTGSWWMLGLINSTMLFAKSPIRSISITTLIRARLVGRSCSGLRARWEVYYKVSLISLFIVPLSRYQFVCSNCKAMWEAPCIHFFYSMPGEEVQLKLVRVGAGVRVNGKLLNKKAPLRFWRQLATAKLP